MSCLNGVFGHLYQAFLHAYLLVVLSKNHGLLCCSFINIQCAGRAAGAWDGWTAADPPTHW